MITTVNFAIRGVNRMGRTPNAANVRRLVFCYLFFLELETKTETLTTYLFQNNYYNNNEEHNNKKTTSSYTIKWKQFTNDV